MGIQLTELRDKDYPLVKEVIDYYILNTTVTLKTTISSLSELKNSIPARHPKYPAFIITYNNIPCGYCYFSQYRNKEAYDRTAEISIYLKPGFTGKGIGKYCINKFKDHAPGLGIEVLVGIITAENHLSIRLFENCGFEKCAHFREVGMKFNRILDVVAYQLILNKS